jgi:two-component system CheB/CheR fusion protein
VLAAFHYALKPDGFLMLGPSETSGFSDLFDLKDKDHRVYTKRLAVTVPPVPLIGSHAGTGPLARGPLETDQAGGRLHVQREADRVLLARYGPPGVLVDDHFDIIHFRGDTSAYLEHPHGEASLNLIRMLPPGTLVEVRRALHDARTTDAPVRRALRLRHGRGAARRVTLEVLPIQGPAAGKGRCFLILFEEEATQRPGAEPTPPPASPSAGDAGDGRITDLENELATTRLYQQTLLEEQGAANEELQSAHEEVLSSNEELQSINEELETAKEELQSANEELTTVNEELQNRNLELGQTTDDLINLLASLNIPIVMLGADLRLRRFTPAAARLFNLIPGDVGRPLGDLRGRLDVSNLDSLIHASIDSVSLKVQEVTDHEGRWYSLRIHPYKTKDNQIDGAVLLLIDVDELKKGVERLEQARSYAETIVESVTHPLLILDARMRVERGNKAFYEMLGTTPAIEEGRSLFELGARQWDVPELRHRLQDLPSSGAPMPPLTVEADFPDVGRRTMVVNARRFVLAEDEPPRILLSSDDRTPEARAIRERENLLIQEESVARQAETASRLKDEFIATVSHELRGPLNAMAGWVHVLGSGALDSSTMTRGISALERAVKAQTRLIEDLLDMSRIMSGKLRLAHRFIDLGEVTRAAIETAAPAAIAKSIQLSFHGGSPPMFVLGDPDRLQQVVWNLLSNAVKFTPPNGRVEVTLRRQGTSTQLQVADSGQGISPEFLPYIFEPFRQADSSPARSHQGLGLGLAIARHLVESHGGVIRADSGGVGRGTTVTVLLPVPPLAADMTPPEEPSDREARRPEPDRSLLADVRVLVVEDEGDSREILATVLREWGAEVLTASSAAEALEALKSLRPDVLVSDIGMPGMDGFELLRQVRQRAPEAGGRVPAIALTAYTDDESRHQAVAAGFEEHLGKPAEPDALLAAVARLAGRRHPSGR